MFYYSPFFYYESAGSNAQTVEFVSNTVTQNLVSTTAGSGLLFVFDSVPSVANQIFNNTFKIKEWYCMKSQACFVSFLTTGDITKGEVPCALVQFQSTTISMVVKSTLATESA